MVEAEIGGISLFKKAKKKDCVYCLRRELPVVLVLESCGHFYCPHCLLQQSPETGNSEKTKPKNKRLQWLPSSLDKVNLHQKREIKNSIDAKKPYNGKAREDYF